MLRYVKSMLLKKKRVKKQVITEFKWYYVVVIHFISQLQQQNLGHFG